MTTATTQDMLSLNSRAQSIIARLPQITAAGAPLVGIPLAPGMRPFVTRRKYLAGQVQGVRNIRAEFRKVGAWTVLHIRGEFGEPGRRCVHQATLYNLNEPEGRGQLTLERRLEHYRWAARIRSTREMAEAAGLDAGAVTGLVPAAKQAKVSPKHTRVQAKIARIDAEIIRLTRMLKDPKVSIRRGGLYWLLGHPPVNPLIGRRETWPGGKGAEVVGKWEREAALGERANKPARKRLSKLAAVYLAKESAKGWSAKRRFAWSEFNTACEAAGIHARVTYQVAHNRKNGPRDVENYLHNPEWFGLGNRQRNVWDDHRIDWVKEMQNHIKARVEYAGVLHTAAEVRSVIEGLRAERQGYVDGLAEMEARGE